jgi:hypothetical protein
MKILCTFLFLSLSILTANSLYAFDKNLNAKLPYEVFPGLKSYQEQLPPEFNDVKGIGKSMPNNLKKKRDEVQGDVYLITDIKIYSETGDSRYSYDYDLKENLQTELHELWQNEQWAYSERISNSYDSKRNMLTSLTEVWAGGHWRNSRHLTKSYNSNNNLETELSENWDWINLIWVKSNNISYSYDTNRLVITFKYWNDYQWIESNRVTNIYDSNGNLQTKLNEACENGLWISTERITYKYDPKGYLKSELAENWISDNKQWINSTRYTITYDLKSNMLQYVTENWSNAEWIISKLSIYTYDINGNRLSWLYETLDHGNIGYKQRYTYTYDANGNKVSEIFENNNNGQWVISEQSSYNFDSNNLLLIALHENWENGEWVQRDSDLSFFDPQNKSYLFNGYKIEVSWKSITSVLENKINISSSAYPNPISNSATIQYNLSEPAFVKLNIYNSFGEKVASLVNEYQTAGEQKVFLDAENYPSGMYFYRLETGRDVISKPIVVIR